MTLLRKLLLMDRHTCPWWFISAFDNPIRRLFHEPGAIFGDLVEWGGTVVDVGCGAGYFTVRMAKMVGPKGRVIAVDLQSRMLAMARRRAERKGLEERIEFRLARPASLGLDEPVDFVLAFWMVHEVREPASLLREIRAALKPSGHLLIAEPMVHVPGHRFDETVRLAEASGFEVNPGPRISFSRSIVCSPLVLEQGPKP